ncbi:hypothetical protein DL770_011642 [Monosporascus sp. CRB-9-2]|nr:hypothetical protein DL770_011642 [Monosporascus sp. CRB-9-2]
MSSQPGDPIAIVGSACKFAGNSSSPSKLWELVVAPHDVHREIPHARFSSTGFYHRNARQPGHANVMHAYLLNEDVSTFDAEFFGVKPVEANAVDPQQRWLMETIYEGLEAGGLTIESLRGSDTALYVGAMSGDYENILLRDLEAIPTYTGTGTARSILSNRISHFFDWRGPSITLDTACSSSLVAVHLAVQALRTGEARVAIACGSNLILGPESFIIESKLKMLSPDGVCRMWDRDANGYARGDGIAAIILKTLREALADGDDIECIIRETGVNQDGATPSITIPSASAQTALIRQTYAKAGLNPLERLEDCPQYFEAHGTGTPTGDPLEAQAIHDAFFANDKLVNGQHFLATSGDKHRSPLYVGSVKTVLGHTEGTAGLAGILKASLALQHGIIPPNLHFHHLSERVAPFYSNLELVHGSTRPWPSIPGVDKRHRRASVNSFGFGGTNAHAILENYSDERVSSWPRPDTFFAPFVFSANSEHSLRASLAAYAEFLGRNPGVDIHNLAWTLRQRRSLLAHRTYFAAESVEELKAQLTAAIQDQTNSATLCFRYNDRGSSGRDRSKLFGIFTGQGAQYARVGAELIERSPLALHIIQSLEGHLAALAPDDRPAWSLTRELLASKKSSRINEATISQPICAAVQILLVDLLALAGVRFDTVLGHSSGEIGAAYAAGALSARDALYIAYFRGLYAAKARSPNGNSISGAMMAVQTSMDDAIEICNDSRYIGRVEVAACNSSSSVTISGDADAIEELEDLFQDEKKFYRRLRVDKAYHSRHMHTCYAPYVDSLRRCGVKVVRPDAQSTPRVCHWFSTVHNRLVNLDEDIGLDDHYWADNMVQPVLFRQALQTSLSFSGDTRSSIFLEIGPHPALQGPATQTIQEIFDQTLPYHGTLVRKANAVTALSATLGFLWQRLHNRSDDTLDVDRYERSMMAGSIEKGRDYHFKVLKNLPTYQWNHNSTYWAESRTSRRLRLRPDSYHPLLGHFTPDSSPHHLCWRNLLRPMRTDEDGGHYDSNLFAGHFIEGQVVVPAAGYVATALEAARALPQAAAVLPPPLLEKETQCHLQLIEIQNLMIHQAVTLTSENSDGVEVLIELADIAWITPGRRIRSRFTYSAVLGRNSDVLTPVASAGVEVLLGREGLNRELLPARSPATPHMIEVDPEVFYTAMADLGYNYQGPFRSMTSLNRKYGRASCVVKVKEKMDVSVTPSQRPNGEAVRLLVNPAELDAAFQSLLLAYSYPKDGQMRTLHLPLRIGHVRVNPALCGSSSRCSTGSGNREKVEGRDAISAEASITQFCQKGATSSQRGGFVGDVNIFNADSSHTAIQVQQVQVVPFAARAGEEDDRKLFMKMQWVDTTYDGDAAAADDASNVDSPQALATRDALARLAIFYLREFDALVPSAGTGGTTKSVLRSLGQSFKSYTFTDVSVGFFGPAATALSSYSQRLVFKALDIEHDPCAQGFRAGAYDVVVASFVLHATTSLRRTLAHVRRLLKPGGFLVVGEGSMDSPLLSFIFGALPGWWLGRGDEGRFLSPAVSAKQWHHLLLESGFSGIDTRSPFSWDRTLGVCLFASQAVDDQVRFLRNPLLQNAPQYRRREKLVLVGGRTACSKRLVKSLETILRRFSTELYAFESLADIEYNSAVFSETAPASVLSLTDLDNPVFECMTEKSFTSFQQMLQTGKTLLWVTSGRLAENPFSNMVVGFGRTATQEIAGLHLQILDLTDPFGPNSAHTIAQAFLRFAAEPTSGEENRDEEIFWTTEPEIVIDADGREKVPRLRPLSELNAHCNSGRRYLAQKVPTDRTPISVQFDHHGTVTLEKLLPICKVANGDYTNHSERELEFHVIQAVLPAIKTPLGHQFLALGLDIRTEIRYLALVSSIASVITIPASQAVPVPVLSVSEAALLFNLACHLVAMEVVDHLMAGQTALIHDAPPGIYEAIRAYGVTKGIETIFVADRDSARHTSAKPSSETIPLAPYLSQAELWQMLPNKERISSFYSLASNDEQLKTRDIISEGLPNCDVTDYDALTTVRTDICNTWAPIAGVFNGAMVLRDTMIENMTFSQLSDVLGPKVTGSLNLDRLFSSDQPTLDFFVLMSSINYTIGNPGQANYAAANAFQCSLAARRRRRGLPGVALNVGAIIGAGYLHRAQKHKMDLTVARGGLMHLSEEDFHQIVAAGVIMGRAGTGDDFNEAELTTGLLEVANDTADRPIWFSDPKFAHLIVQRGGEASELEPATPTEGRTGGSAKPIAISLFKDKIHACRSRQDLFETVKEAFAAQLRYELQMKTTGDDKLMRMHSNELGIDSLISVDIRNWFLKSLSVSIPVLRIMSNDTMLSLVQHAVENIPPDMVRQIPQGSPEVHVNGVQSVQTASGTSSAGRFPADLASETSSTAPGDLIDWDAETYPPAADEALSAVLQTSPDFTGPASYPPRLIVLTGATGLLGSHLLSHLLQTTPVTTKVACIAVRRLYATSQQELLSLFSGDVAQAAKSNRVSFYAGDLGLPRLGLSLSDCSDIFAAADAVIHTGADTSHLKPYTALRDVNVGSTRELARLCLWRKVSLHFVSSAGVGLFSANGERELYPARAPGTPPTSFGGHGNGAQGVLSQSGYTASKWAGERLLERTSARHGLPVWIHRPSTIIRQGLDAQGARARLDWLNQLVLYACEMGTVPALKHVTGALDLVYVRNVCEQLARSVLDHSVDQKAEDTIVSYVHEVGDIIVPLERMEDLLLLNLNDPHAGNIPEGHGDRDQPSKIGDTADKSGEKLSMAEWTERAVARGLHPAVATLIESMDAPDTPVFLALKRGSSSVKAL